MKDKKIISKLAIAGSIAIISYKLFVSGIKYIEKKINNNLEKK